VKPAHPSLFKFPFAAMASPCEIQIYAGSQTEAFRISELAIADARRLEQSYSRYRDDSLLSEINRVAATGGSIDVDEETAGLIDYADACHLESDGLFDVTSGILRHAWRLKEGKLPEAGAIEALLDRIGWHKVRWEAPRLEFPPGMEIDFGGIVKEYAADRLATLCWNAGARHGIINLGGDIRVIGPHLDGRPWGIGVQDPRRKNAALGTLAIHHGGVATSGDYERCVTIDGKRYGHVLNPKTGWPVQFLASVTVVGDYCVVAGSASTIAMLKEESGPAWLESLGLEHYWVDVHGNAGGSLAERFGVPT
jgi:thiamine biosynthesis lipoprotein